MTFREFHHATASDPSLATVVRAFADYKKVVEGERTRRDLIAARLEIIAGLFERLNQGLDSGNDALDLMRAMDDPQVRVIDL